MSFFSSRTFKLRFKILVTEDEGRWRKRKKKSLKRKVVRKIVRGTRRKKLSFIRSSLLSFHFKKFIKNVRIQQSGMTTNSAETLNGADGMVSFKDGTFARNLVLALISFLFWLITIINFQHINFFLLAEHCKINIGRARAFVNMCKLPTCLCWFWLPKL